MTADCRGQAWLAGVVEFFNEAVEVYVKHCVTCCYGHGFCLGIWHSNGLVAVHTGSAASCMSQRNLIRFITMLAVKPDHYFSFPRYLVPIFVWCCLLIFGYCIKKCAKKQAKCASNVFTYAKIC